MCPKSLGLLVALSSLAAVGPGVRAQELEPRAYAPNPTGANFLLAAYGYSSGDVLFDPAAPVTDVTAHVSASSLAYGRTFGLLGRAASVTLVTTYVLGRLEGNVGEEQRRVDRSGLADLRFRLACNLVGGPALTPAEFAKRPRGTTLGASLIVVAPVGQYDPAKLINIGTNRWAFKPELGLSRPAGRWVGELYGGVWLFTDNDRFFGSSLRQQSPLATFQTHVSYTFRPRLWLAADATFYAGGRTTVNGAVSGDLQSNSRGGLTLAVPVKRRSSLKASWAKGITTSVGGDFDALSVAYQFLWF
jgi:hypothetical protein